MTTPSGVPFDWVDNSHHRLQANSDSSIGPSDEYHDPAMSVYAPDRGRLSTGEPSEGTQTEDFERLEATLRWLRQQRAEFRKLHRDQSLVPLVAPARKPDAVPVGLRTQSWEGMSSPRRSCTPRRTGIRTPLLIFLVGLVAAPSVYFFARKFLSRAKCVK
jgi:hypothetical protein